MERAGVEIAAEGIKQLEIVNARVEDFNKLLSNTAQISQQTTKINDTLIDSFRMEEESSRILASAIMDATNALREQMEAQQQARQAAEAAAQARQAQAEQTRKATQIEREHKKAAEEAAKAYEQSIHNIGQYTKQLLLAGLGVAAFYRGVQKIKQVFSEVIESVFENTEAYQRMQEAQDKLKVSIVGMLGSYESMERHINTIANMLDWFSDKIEKATATVRGMAAWIETAFTRAVVVLVKSFQVLDESLKGNTDTASQLRDELLSLIKENPVALMTSYLDAYNKSLEDSAELQTRYAKATANAQIDTQKQTQAIKEQETAYRKLIEALIAAEEARIRAYEDLMRQMEQKLRDLYEDLARDLEDLALKGARKREDIELDYRRKMEDIERKAADDRARAEDQLRLRLIQIEMRYREQLIRIEEDFQDAMYNAISRRDATAALQAMRRRDRDLGRAARERDDAIAIARMQYENQIKDQQQALERMRQDAAIARQRALEDLQRDMERERQDINKDHQRKLEDLQIFLRRRLEDIQRNYEDQVQKAEAFYNRDESQYIQHLEKKLQALRRYWQQVSTMNKLNMSTTGGWYGGGLGGGSKMNTPTTGMPSYSVPSLGASSSVIHPTSTASNFNVTTTMRHHVEGQVEAMMAGFEGRLGAAITDAVVKVVGEVIQ